MSDKITVLMVHNSYKIKGGEDTVVEQEKELLERKGHRVITYFRDNTELDSLSGIKKLLASLSFIYNKKTYKDIKRIIKEEKVQLLYVHNTFCLISPSVYYAAIDSGIEVFQTVHNFRMFCPNALLYTRGQVCEDCINKGLKCSIKKACYHSSKLQTLICCLILIYNRSRKIYKKLNYICLTELSKEIFLRGMKNYIDENKLYIKANFTKDRYEELKKADKKTYDTDYYLYAGRLSSEKGPLELVNSWPFGLKEPLLIIGDGPLRPELESLINSYAASKEPSEKKKIILLGRKDHEETLSYIFKAKAVIFPSVCYETQGVTIAEACMCARPVIANNVGNGATVKEIAPELVLDINDKEWLEKTIKTLDSSDYREELSEKFRQYYLNNYTKEESYKRLMEYFRGSL